MVAAIGIQRSINAMKTIYFREHNHVGSYKDAAAVEWVRLTEKAAPEHEMVCTDVRKERDDTQDDRHRDR